jgi:hypothetical protein
MEPLGWIAAGLRPHGLVLRGGFHPEPADAVPPLADGRPARTLAMIGNIGAAGGDPMWRAFAQARARYAGADPLNDWTRDAVAPLARAADAAALFPFDRPYHPFQRWAMRAEPVFPSPLGLLVHPVHGLWHAYRAALVFAERIGLPPRAAAVSPCEACAEKPCLAACPVGAFDGTRYDVPRCVAFIDSAEGADCMGRGCRVRRACPVGRGRAQEPAQAEFHMRAFRRAQRPPHPSTGSG